MSQEFVEYRDVSSTEPLRQGDVLESAEEDASKWQRNLFVLTADCDFAHGKHQGRVTCVPFLTAEEYLLELHLPPFRNRLVDKPLAEFQTILNRLGFPNVTSARARAWAVEGEVTDVIGSIGAEDADRYAAEKALNAIRMIDAPATSITEATNLLVEAQLLSSNPPKRSTAVTRVKDRMHQAFSQTPGDAFFVSALGPSHESGYFAYLRHLEQVWQPEISIGPGNSKASYRRISRIEDRYSHALVQQFGMVFMPIGLPRDYEDMRGLHAELVTEEIR